jgi:16S rRNA processing protein RimM
LARGASAGEPGRRSRRPAHLVIGRILGPHGLGGEVKVEILTDFPERYSLLKTVLVGEQCTPVVLEGHRMHGARILLKLAGCENREDADELRGQLIRVPIDEAMPLEENEYYLHEIVGLEVWTAEEEYLGCVEEVIETGGNDVYVVRDGEREILIPALSDVVLDVDLDEGRMEVRLMKGLR